MIQRIVANIFPLESGKYMRRENRQSGIEESARIGMIEMEDNSAVIWSFNRVRDIGRAIGPMLQNVGGTLAHAGDCGVGVEFVRKLHVARMNRRSIIPCCVCAQMEGDVFLIRRKFPGASEKRKVLQ